ncbi:hypothetical protein [Cytobacillus praedii]|uniref:DUF2187 domain-containing protein n=1 Tax=Cytobacillus praedii TaxID=1742358 RepID=A0A4R1ANS1_9BACI|nr:hypothetical protein [Cytobacillus praedii]TCJ00964.1 hypothetical protein E0Y62_26405 [Cytobacillus praedii]
MKIGQRVRVIEEESLFHERLGTIMKIERYYIVVQLDNYPYEMKFIDEELKLVEGVEWLFKL